VRSAVPPPALAVLLTVMVAAVLAPATARGFGDEGHEIIGLIAYAELDPAVRAKVDALLAGDESGLTPDRGIAAESTWADRYRDADRATTRTHYLQTRAWHYVDLELEAADLDTACLPRAPLTPGVAASAGPAEACIVDKIAQFESELRDPATALVERRLALQFLLHLVGDLHQPLHAADAHDQGGNGKRAAAAGGTAGTLHGVWDTVLVARLGADPHQVAAQLVRALGQRERRRWRRGNVDRWALESFAIARKVAYGRLPAPDSGSGAYPLDAAYLDPATRAVAVQLQRAGVRLAMMLERDLR